MEARAEMQQRKQQQQHRQQLEQLAASLRAVEKDIEAVKNALAPEAVEVLSNAEKEALTRFYSTKVEKDEIARLSSSPFRNCPLDIEVGLVRIVLSDFCCHSATSTEELPNANCE